MRKICSAATVLLVVAAGVDAGGEDHGIMGLGSLGGTWSHAYDINNAGQIVGASADASDTARPFLWSKGRRMTDLGTLPGMPWGKAEAINDLGWAVGTSWDYSGQWRATLWRPGQVPKDIGSLSGFPWSAATDVNGLGQVVGYAYRWVGDHPEYSAFLWTEDGGMADLGSLGGTWTEATAISDSGQVVGLSEISYGSPSHAFLWTVADGIREFPAPAQGQDCVPLGINDAGDVVGMARDSSGTGLDLPSLWRQLGAQPAVFPPASSLPADIRHGCAVDVNGTGLVAGRYYYGASHGPKAFAWDGGDSFVTLPSFAGARNWRAEALNDSGWIVGQCSLADGSGNAAVWVPGLVPGDANLDGETGIADLAALADHYGATCLGWIQGDLNGDRVVGIADLAILADNYGRTISVHSVPEPAALLLMTGGLLLAQRRGRRAS